jgi:hypothetical protein
MYFSKQSLALGMPQHEKRRGTKPVVADMEKSSTAVNRTAQEAMDLDHPAPPPATINFFPSYQNIQ